MTDLTISIRLRSIDNFRQSRSFKSLAGARVFAQTALGAKPDLGSTYAISSDGVVKLTVSGASLPDLFPALKPVSVSHACHCESSQVYGGDCIHTLTGEEDAYYEALSAQQKPVAAPASRSAARDDNFDDIPF